MAQVAKGRQGDHQPGGQHGAMDAFQDVHGVHFGEVAYRLKPRLLDVPRGTDTEVA